MNASESMNGYGGVVVILVIANHLDVEEPFAHIAVAGNKLLIAFEVDALGPPISAVENFLVSVSLGVDDDAAEDTSDGAGAEDATDHDLVAGRDADLGVAVVDVAGRRVCCS
jgi:hypothetical protein